MHRESNLRAANYLLCRPLFTYSLRVDLVIFFTKSVDIHVSISCSYPQALYQICIVGF